MDIVRNQVISWYETADNPIDAITKLTSHLREWMRQLDDRGHEVHTIDRDLVEHDGEFVAIAYARYTGVR